MTLPRYGEYRDSGVEWLREVPRHWEVSRLGFETWVRARLGWKGLKAEEYVEDGFVFLATPNIKGWGIDFDNVNYINQHRYDESPEIQLRKGDVLLAKDGSTLGTVNVVRHLPRPATVNSSIAVITPRPSIDSVFLYYLFQSTFMIGTIQQIKGGMGVPHLFQEDLNKFALPVPSVSEQTAIAAFLDRETGKIDALVAEQEKLIALLKEKRQAVISHAVTKGLDPAAPMKPSGSTWLGDVPAHWHLKRLKHLVSHVVDCLHTTPTYDGDLLYPAIRTADVEPGRLLLQQARLVSEDVYLERIQRLKPEPGDLLYSREGERFGMAALVPEGVDLCLGQRMMMFRIGRPNVPAYFMWVLNSTSVYQQVQEGASGPTAPHVNIGDIINFLVPAPDVAEQLAIANFVDRETAKLNALTAEAQRAIDLLKERRTALISAAVTGKIDVRGLVDMQEAA
jgi:type I restriction enzyme, S subunit